MFEVVQEYFYKNPHLGYRSVSEFLNELIRSKANEIIKSKKIKKEISD